jgi:hypothetical protein
VTSVDIKHGINYSCINFTNKPKSRSFMHGARNVLDLRSVSRVLARKPKGKRPLGRSRRRCYNNIKLAVMEMGWGCMD